GSHSAETPEGGHRSAARHHHQPDPAARPAAGSAAWPVPRSVSARSGPRTRPVLRQSQTGHPAAFCNRCRAEPGATDRNSGALDGLRSATTLQFAARTASDLEFRRALLDHVELIRPIFCLFYPHLFTMRLVATAHTDDCGHFHTLFFNGCNNPDTPDLYFKV